MSFIKAIPSYQQAINRVINSPSSIDDFTKIDNSIKDNIKSFEQELKSIEGNYDKNIIKSDTVKVTPLSNGLSANTIANLSSVLSSTEKLSTGLINGSASLSDTVASVVHAEILIKSVVTIRDKLVSAFQDIVKMQM